MQTNEGEEQEEATYKLTFLTPQPLLLLFKKDTHFFYRYGIKVIKSKCNEEENRFLYRLLSLDGSLLYVPPPFMWDVVRDDRSVSLVLDAVYRRSLKLTQYKILQNQDFQSCIFIYHKRSLCLKLISRYIIYASRARNGRPIGRLDKQAVFFVLFCVSLCLQYCMSSRVHVCFCGDDDTAFTDWPLKLISLFTHACYSYKFWYLIHEW